MPTTTLTLIIDPQALDAFQTRMDALRDTIDATGQAERFWTMIDETYPPRTIPRVLPPSEPCSCILCRRRRGDLVNNHVVVSNEVVSDEAAAASARAVFAHCTTAEIAHIRTALRLGRIEGTSTAACFLARILECRGLHYGQMPQEWAETPIEAWVIAHIRVCDKPENSEHAALLDRWLTIALEDRGWDAVMDERQRLSFSMRDRTMPPSLGAVVISMDDL